MSDNNAAPRGSAAVDTRWICIGRRGSPIVSGSRATTAPKGDVTDRTGKCCSAKAPARRSRTPGESTIASSASVATTSASRIFRIRSGVAIRSAASGVPRGAARVAPVRKTFHTVGDYSRESCVRNVVWSSRNAFTFRAVSPLRSPRFCRPQQNRRCFR
jgi:hypothetical protein